MAQLDAVVAASPHYPLGVVAAAVGLACAAFGGLLGIDHAAFLPVSLASSVGQYVRHTLLERGHNPYVATITTAFLCGSLIRLVGSGTVNLAAIASTLLLVPGITATNAQADILNGLPTMGSARAVSMPK
ncbi:MAG: threonine/serine exporter family protein [Rhodopila sp.]